MKVKNYKGAKNQFIIEDKKNRTTTFQSYDSTIAIKDRFGNITLGIDWDYSSTTGKYRNMFLCEDKKATQKKIDNGTYKIDVTI